MLSDSEIRSICVQELTDNTDSGDLATDRSKALDYYYGDMSDYVEAAKGRSEITTRDVLDTIESILPSLIKIFVEEENAIVGKPVSQADEPQATLETQAIRTVFYSENEGFLNLYTYLKDALLSKMGTFMTFSEENPWVREEYENLDIVEVQKILNDETIEYEIEDVEQTEKGINLTCLTKKKQVSVKVDVVTPEELGVSSDASSVNIKKARFSWHTTQKTIGELILAGFDKDILDDIPINDQEGDNQERLSRRHLSDEEELSHAHRSMQNVWVTQCYPLIDRDEDGIPERLKVVLVGGTQSGYSNAKLLDIEESRVPYSSGTPVILTHKYYGYSIADLVMDIQEMRTVFFRNIYDNMYLANNVRMGANENANLDDLLTVRPGGVCRTRGTDSPSNHIVPIVHPQIAPQSFGLLEVFDQMLKNRTGVGDEVAGLDSNSLANINTGVIQQAYSQARMRIELIARILGETGLKQCFEDIHRELHLKQSHLVQMKINNQWVDVDPRIWRKDRKFQVKIGIGNQDKIQKKQNYLEILGLQEKATATGYMTPQHIHNTVSDLMLLEGNDINRYFPDPKTFKPPEKQPDPKLLIEAERVKIEQQRADNDMFKAQSDNQIKVMMAQSKEREQQNKGEIEAIKGEMQLQKMLVDEQSQIMRAHTENMTAQVTNEVKVRDMELKERIAAFESMLEQQKLDQKDYEAELKSVTDLETTSMEVEQRAQSDILKHIQALTQMVQTSEENRMAERHKILEYVKVNGSDQVREFAGGLD